MRGRVLVSGDYHASDHKAGRVVCRQGAFNVRRGLLKKRSYSCEFSDCLNVSVLNYTRRGRGGGPTALAAFNSERNSEDERIFIVAKHDDDNHANQLNPNNDAYWESRGWDERPEDWDQRIKDPDPDSLFPSIDD